MSEHKLSQMDAQETWRHSFDEAQKAHRVAITGIESINLDADMGKTNELLAQLLENSNKSQKITVVNDQNQIQVIEIPKIVNETFIQKIEVPTIIKEFVPIEVTKIIIQEVIKEVDKPVYIKEIEIKTVEIPSQASFPQWLKLCMVAQAIGIVGILLVNIFRH